MRISSFVAKEDSGPVFEVFVLINKGQQVDKMSFDFEYCAPFFCNSPMHYIFPHVCVHELMICTLQG